MCGACRMEICQTDLNFYARILRCTTSSTVSKLLTHSLYSVSKISTLTDQFTVSFSRMPEVVFEWSCRCRYHRQRVLQWQDAAMRI